MERTIPPKRRLSETLSSDTLFTFTSKLDYLTDMLTVGIKPRYIYEHIPIPDRTWYYIVAAKCFCDIPLGKIKSHLVWFGNYGLGISKKYLQEKGVSPVIYIHSKSYWIVDALTSNGINELKKYPTLPFLKRYYGEDFKFEENALPQKKLRRFYDEREWRYIPKKNNDLYTGMDIASIKEGIELAREKNIKTPYNKNPIQLDPKYVEYIIINKYDEFKSLKAKLRIIYTNDDTYELMLSKILIAERIVRDF